MDEVGYIKIFELEASGGSLTSSSLPATKMTDKAGNLLMKK